MTRGETNGHALTVSAGRALSHLRHGGYSLKALIPGETAADADALAGRMEAAPAAIAAGEMSRSVVLRLALAAGLHALEVRHGRGRKDAGGKARRSRRSS